MKEREFVMWLDGVLVGCGHDPGAPLTLPPAAASLLRARLRVALGAPAPPPDETVKRATAGDATGFQGVLFRGAD
jgi:hypothetical protein